MRVKQINLIKNYSFFLKKYFFKKVFVNVFFVQCNAAGMLAEHFLH